MARLPARCPPGPDKLAAGSKKLTISDDGILASAKDLSEAQVAAIGFSEVILNGFINNFRR